MARANRRQPQQARGHERIERILDAAETLLGDGDPAALTTTAVARTAATSVGSIYEYFPDRQAIAVTLATRLADRYHGLHPPSVASATLGEVLVDHVTRWWHDHPAIAALWWSAPTRGDLAPAGALLRQRVVATTADVIAGATGLPSAVLAHGPAEVATALVTGVLHGATTSSSADRAHARRDASIAVDAILATRLPVPVPAGSAAPSPPPHPEARPAPAEARSTRALDGRQRMLDAAVDRLIEHGYGGATTLAIQAAAGVSRGRLLHQFPSRELLLVAAAEHLADQRVRATRRRVVQIVSADREGRRRIDHVVELMWESHQEPHFWAASELWMAARTNGEIANALRPHERRLGATIRAAVGEMFGEPYVGDRRFAMLCDLLLTSMRGVAATYAFERRTPARDPHLVVWKELAHLLLASPAEAGATNSQP